MGDILSIDAANPRSEALEKAARTLAAGRLVIVPTETVYGIACDPSVPGALERLLAAKGRDAGKPIARLAADADAVRALSKEWNSGIQALVDAFWPGPLTLVLETSNGWTGFRVPDHPVALALAKRRHLLALTSANPSGMPDTRTAAAAMAAIEADLVLDSGPAETGIPSTVARVSGSRLECLREGSLPFSELQSVFQRGVL